MLRRIQYAKGNTQNIAGSSTGPQRHRQRAGKVAHDTTPAPRKTGSPQSRKTHNKKNRTKGKGPDKGFHTAAWHNGGGPVFQRSRNRPSFLQRTREKNKGTHFVEKWQLGGMLTIGLVGTTATVSRGSSSTKELRVSGDDPSKGDIKEIGVNGKL